MLKRLLLLAGLLSLVATSAFGAGTVPGFSLTPQFDTLGKVAPGCRLYVIQAGTTSTPQNSYQDTGLTILQPNPIVCDSTGRLPQWFVADGSIKLRLTDKNGVQLFVGDNLLVVGPSSGGGGGGGTVDPTTILQTGDFKQVYGTGVLTGFVRCNGRTIGSATSGATERANADTSALFSFLWGSDPNLAVSGGRGASSAADYAANKTLTLPDCRGRVMAGLDDMGNSAAGRLTSSYFGTLATVLGAVGGSENTTLTLAQIPTGITSSGSNTVSVSSLPFNLAGTTGAISDGAAQFGGGNTPPARSGGGNWQGVNNMSGSVTINSTSNNTGGQAHRTVPPAILVTTYIKL
jgi:microcystin-dependent protein